MFARMNVLSTESVKVDYSVQLDRFSIIRDNEWLSVGTTAFQLLNTLATSNHEFERVVVQQSGSEIEIIKLLGNYLLTFRSKTLTSSVVLTSNVMKTLCENHTRIMTMVRVERNRRGGNMEINKKRKFGTPNKGNLTVDIRNRVEN